MLLNRWTSLALLCICTSLPVAYAAPEIKGDRISVSLAQTRIEAFRQTVERLSSIPGILDTLGITIARADDPLLSWNDGPAKQSIISFVEKVTKAGSPDFVPVPERIAVFDNDGTLWAEQPMYFQLFFALDRIKALAPQHPEWKDKEPFASLLKGDVKAALAGGDRAIEVATESLSLNPRSRRHREELAATQALLERTGPIVTQTIGMTRAFCDHYDPTIADETRRIAIGASTAVRK